MKIACYLPETVVTNEDLASGQDGWTPEKMCETRFGQSMIAAYTRGSRPTCKYKNWIRFCARVDAAREEMGIGPLAPYLEAAKAKEKAEKEV